MPYPRPFPAALADLCQRWLPGRRLRGLPLAGEGFSGSPVWRVDVLDAAGAVERSNVLKAFAAGWPFPRAEAIHRYVSLLVDAGIGEIPRVVPLAAPAIGSLAEDADGRIWELSEFRPGRPVQQPTPAQAREALECLGRIHLATGGRRGDGLFPAPRPEECGPDGVPAWERRRQRLVRVAERGWCRSTRPVLSPWERRIDSRRAAAAAILERVNGRTTLGRLATLPAAPPRRFGDVTLQPVLRDVWQAHLLFEGPRIAAVIDLHAAGIDTPATDLARLLGSWRPATGRNGGEAVPSGQGVAPAKRLSAIWSDALDAYRAIRPLGPSETRLIDLLHVGGVVGGLDSWFQWVLGDGKAFESPLQVEARVDFLLENLDSALQAADSLLREAG